MVSKLSDHIGGVVPSPQDGHLLSTSASRDSPFSEKSWAGKLKQSRAETSHPRNSDCPLQRCQCFFSDGVQEEQESRIDLHMVGIRLEDA